MVLHDVTILSGERGPWATPPSKQMIGRDGTVMKDDSGKVRYSPVVEFASADPRLGGPCPINITLSAAELLILRDAHYALLREASRHPVNGEMSEWEYHSIRFGHVDTLVCQVAPTASQWTGYNRNPHEADR